MKSEKDPDCILQRAIRNNQQFDGNTTILHILIILSERFKVIETFIRKLHAIFTSFVDASKCIAREHFTEQPVIGKISHIKYTATI